MKKTENKWEFETNVAKLQELLTFWNDTAIKARHEADYYQEQLRESHELLGRVVHQTSHRWDSVRLTKHKPTNNLSNKILSDED